MCAKFNFSRGICNKNWSSIENNNKRVVRGGNEKFVRVFFGKEEKNIGM